MFYIRNLILLKQHINSTFGPHYPTDIIQHIFSMISYQPIKISCYQDNTCAIVNDKVYLWGRFADQVIRKPLRLELSIPHLKQVKCDADRIIILTNLNDLYVWHNNPKIRLYDNTQIQFQPVAKSIKKILFSQKELIYVIKNDDTCELYMQYQYILHDLQIQIRFHKIIKIKLINENMFILTSSGALLRAKYISSCLCHDSYPCTHLYKPHKPKILLENIIKIKCGLEHMVVLTSDAKIYVWGSNQCGQLGLPSIKNMNILTELVLPGIVVKKISCGANYTIILTVDNKLYSFGSNKYGQLGLGDCRMRSVPEQIMFTFPLIKSIRSGSHHTICTTIIGDIYVWGRNTNCQLGLGDNIGRKFPTKLS